MNQQTQSSSSGREFYNKLVEEGPVANIENLVHSPLGSGYFFKFCKSKFCSETTNFIIEVDRFIEVFASDDGGWEEEKSWKDIDKELALSGNSSITVINVQRDITDKINSDSFIPEETWPSGKVDRALVLERVQSIWTRFLAENSVDQICLPASVRMNTCKRMMNIHRYGKDVFQEACRDPSITSTQRDIAMRFQSSDEYQQYMRRFLELTKPACAISIHIPGPRYTLSAMYTKNQLMEVDNAVLFAMDQFLLDNFLYSEFMRHLNFSVASENLRFIRAVHIFKKSMAATDLSIQKKANEWAFKMYQNFIRPGCAYEICVSESVRRDIARNLASPHADMFERVEKVTYSTLKVLFEAYTLTEDYLNLRVKLFEKFDDFEQQVQIRSGQNSFSFGTVNSKMSMARVLRENHTAMSNASGSLRPAPPGGRSSLNNSSRNNSNNNSTHTNNNNNNNTNSSSSNNNMSSSSLPASPRSHRQLTSPTTPHNNPTNNNITNNNNNHHHHHHHNNHGSPTGPDIAAMLTVVTALADAQQAQSLACGSASTRGRTTTRSTPMSGHSTESHLARGLINTPRARSAPRESAIDNDPASAVAMDSASSALCGAFSLYHHSKKNPPQHHQTVKTPFEPPSANNSSRASSRVTALPGIPAAGSGSGEDEDPATPRQNVKHQKTAGNSMFSSATGSLPVLSWFGMGPSKE